MNKVIFYTSKDPISIYHIPKLNDPMPIIGKSEVMKRTAKGYRLKVSFAREKGSVYLDEHYNFFESYEAALKFVENEVAKVTEKLDELKRKAMELSRDAQDALQRHGVRHD